MPDLIDDLTRLLDRPDAGAAGDGTAGGRDRDRLVSDRNVIRLTACGIFQTTRTPVFDRVVDHARRIFGCRTSLLTIIDEANDRQVFKAESGLPLSLGDDRQTPLSLSFCRHVVQSSAPVVIRDARTDPRVMGNEAIGIFGAVAYLGVPVRDETGQAIAALCLVEPMPRSWTAAHVALLQSMGDGLSTQIRHMFLPQMQYPAQIPATDRAGREATLTYFHGPEGVERIEHASAETIALWGVTPSDYASRFTNVFGMCLAQDLLSARASFGNSAGGMIPWHHRWRIRTAAGQLRWLEGQGVPVLCPGGGILWTCAIRDITPRLS